MVDVVSISQHPPPLRRPVLVAAFEGWNDAGESASSAVKALRRELSGHEFATIDPEEFFDFQVARPNIVLSPTGSGKRELSWPHNRLSWATLPDQDRHVVLLEGTEPNVRWKTFTAGVLGLAADLGVELVIMLGSLQVDVPHSRPVPVSGSATSPEHSERLALQTSKYEGPTGIAGVFSYMAVDAGFEVVSLWAGVPHYMAASCYHAGALALANRVGRLLDVSFPLELLKDRVEDQQDEVTAVVADDAELAEYVTELEAQCDQHPARSHDMVSGDDLVAELERFLRERGTE